MSMRFQGVKLNYPSIDKQAFAVFKVIKHFQPYILNYHTKVTIPHPCVRYFLIQKEPEHRRGNWLTSLQEYYLEIKLAKLVQGQALCKLAAKMLEKEVLYMPTPTNSWYNDIKYYLTHGINPRHLDARKR